MKRDYITQLAGSTWFSVPLRPSLRFRIPVCCLSGEIEWTT